MSNIQYNQRICKKKKEWSKAGWPHKYNISPLFVAQPAKHIPRVFAIKGHRPLIELVKGKVVADLWVFGNKKNKMREYLVKNRFTITDQLARAFVDDIKYGIFHGDLHGGNFVLKNGSKGPHLTLIDFHHSHTANDILSRKDGSFWYSMYMQKEYGDALKSLSLFTRNKKQNKELQEYFKRKLEENIRKL